MHTFSLRWAAEMGIADSFFSVAVFGLVFFCVVHACDRAAFSARERCPVELSASSSPVGNTNREMSYAPTAGPRQNLVGALLKKKKVISSLLVLPWRTDSDGRV